MYYGKQKKSKKSYKTEIIPKRDPNKPKIVKRYYHITSQTKDNIIRLALSENTTEGMVLDKIVRTYMAWVRMNKEQTPTAEQPYR